MRNAVAVTQRCPACSADVPTTGTKAERTILPYKPVYLCQPHRELWTVADAHDSAPSLPITATA